MINLVYVVFYNLQIFFNVIFYAYMWSNIVYFDKVQFTADIFFVNMTTLIVFEQFLVLGSRLEIPHLTNYIMRLGQHLEGREGFLDRFILSRFLQILKLINIFCSFLRMSNLESIIFKWHKVSVKEKMVLSLPKKVC